MKQIKIIVIMMSFFLINSFHVNAQSKSIETSTIGMIESFTGNTIPSHYLLADGKEVSRTEYKELFKVIGTTYGAGNGSTTFNLPNLKGRIIVGEDSNQTEFNFMGKTGGESVHVLTKEELPSHTHIFTGSSITTGYNSVTPTATFNGAKNITISDARNHTHSRGNMEIYGIFVTRALITGVNIAQSYSGAFGVTLDTGQQWSAAINRLGSKNLATDVINFQASRNWSGVTSTEGAHYHTLTPSGTVTLNNTTHNHTFTAAGTNSHTGENQSHNNMQPYIVIQYIIRVK